MKRTVLFLLASLMAAPIAEAQQAAGWQWGRRGGGGYNDIISGDRSEAAEDMAVDKAGNVYVLSNYYFQQNDVNVDGHALTSPGYGDVVISSFTCNGTYRWSKVIGAPTSSDRAYALRTDTLGGVYVSAQLYNLNAGTGLTRIGPDTSLGVSMRTMFLIKYDTAGNYQWLRRPQPDTASMHGISYCRIMDMDVDGGGNVYWMCRLTPGNYEGTGCIVSSEGVYMLRYDRYGNLLSGTPMAIDVPAFGSSVFEWYMRRSPANGKYIVTGMPIGTGTPPVFGTTTVDRTAFVGCFNANGSLDWVKQTSMAPPQGASQFQQVDIDAQGGIYIPCNGASGDVFEGATFSNYVAPGSGFQAPVVIKLDAAGNLLWCRAANATIGIALGAGAVTSAGEYVVGGNWGGQMRWPGAADSISRTNSAYPDVFISRFNAQTGSHIRTDTLTSNPLSPEKWISCMAADRKGNFYAGGLFFEDIRIAGQTLHIVPGGRSDLFVARYGTANCNCNTPGAAFTGTKTALRTIQFAYTGTTAGIDSVVWNFGDGQRQRVTANYTAPLTHTYAANGHYTATASAYNSCGANTATGQTYALRVADASSASGIRIYPNPTTVDYVTIEGVPGASYQLSDIAGREVARGTCSSRQERVDLSKLPAGSYLLQIKSPAGLQKVSRLIKL